MDHLLRQGLCIVVADFIDPRRARTLASELRSYFDRTPTVSDGQAARSPAAYNFAPFVELLLEKLHDVSARVGSSLFPTFSYARSYVHGERLAPHVDRPASEISATVHLDGDVRWPIHFGHRVKGEQEVELLPGQAAIYLGCETTHWREPYAGRSYEQVFLHYVRSRGKYASACFDNQTPHINGIRY